MFDELKRAFSHDGTRISEPLKLAGLLLHKDSTWTTEKIVAAMHAGKEPMARLKPEERVPVVIGYFMAWVGADGKLNFRSDGHDKNMTVRYFAVAESLARQLNITTTDTTLNLPALQGTVIGIVKDFRVTSFKSESPPVRAEREPDGCRSGFYPDNRRRGPGYIGSDRADMDERISQQTLRVFFFVDDLVEQIYSHEKRLASLFTVFAGLAIALSVMGLFSLLALMVR